MHGADLHCQIHALGSALAEVANTLKRECNERAAIHKLPPEILAHIFHHVRAPASRAIQDIGNVYDLTPLPDFRSLIRATHVCRRWRSAATSCPSLWNILPAPYRIAGIFFTRSGKLPLELHINSGDGYTAVVDSPQHSNRIVSLVSSTSDCGDMPLSALAHCLNYLEIRSPTPYYSNQYSDDPPIITFRPKTPCLRALSLNLRTGASVNDFFPHLAHLRFAGGKNLFLDVRALLELLEGTPCLETLHIIHTELEIDDDDALPIATLDHLRTLCIDSPGFAGASALMTHLSFPSTASVQLHRLDVTYHREDLQLPPLAELTVLEFLEVRLCICACVARTVEDSGCTLSPATRSGHAGSSRQCSTSFLVRLRA